MNASRTPLFFLLCVWAGACGGSDFTSAPVGQPDAAAGSPDASVDAQGGQGGTSTGGNAGSQNGGSAGSAGTGGTGGVAGAAGTGGTGGVAGAAGTGGTGGVAGTAGTAGTGAAPACPSGQACFENLPAGWTPVATGTSELADCDLPMHELYWPTDVVAANDFTCACNCGISSGGCAPGLVFHIEASCTASSTTPAAVSMACSQCTANPNNASHLEFQVIATGSCAAPSPAAPPPVSVSGYECSAYAGGGSPAACENNGVCIKNIVSTAKTCVLHAGKIPCPAGFTIPSTYYESLEDTRSCDGVCSCEPSCACTGSDCQLKIHPDADCKGVATFLTAGACTPKPGTYGATFSADLVETPKPACHPKYTSAHLGGVIGNAEVTICCKP